MAYLAIAYPTISEKDLSYIQEYRKVNDVLYYNVVSPHFTIVFPTFDISETDFVNEVEKLSHGSKKFKFVLRCATLNKDAFSGDFHEFLVPDEGHSDFVKLHDKLYSEKLLENLRLDIDFIPHVGIGNSKDPQICKKRIDLLNKENFEIHGQLESLDIVKYENDSIITIKKIELK